MQNLTISYSRSRIIDRLEEEKERAVKVCMRRKSRKALRREKRTAARSAAFRRRVLACSRTRNRIVLMPFKLIELENESMWRYGTIKEGEGRGGERRWTRRKGGGERLESGFGWMDTQKGAHGCATTQPPPLLQTPQLPGTATARPEVTRLLPTMHLRPSVYPSFHLSILHPSIRSPLRLLPFVSRSVPTHPPFLPSPFTDPVIHMCVHVVVRNVISALVHENFRGLVEDCLRIFRKPGLLYRDKVLKNDFGIYFCWTRPMQ